MRLAGGLRGGERYEWPFGEGRESRERDEEPRQEAKRDNSMPRTLRDALFPQSFMLFFYGISHSKSAEKERKLPAPCSHYCCAGSGRNTFESDVIVNLKHFRQRAVGLWKASLKRNMTWLSYLQPAPAKIAH